MRRFLLLPALVGVAAAWLPVAPAGATIVDAGEVVLSGDDLTIGNTANGSRTVDAEADGVYDEVRIAVASGVTGALTLDHAASFTAGSLLAGVDGAASIDVMNGSALTTGSAELHAADIALSGGATWVNSGGLTYFSLLGTGPSIAITGGADVSVQGLTPQAFTLHGVSVTVDGAGASWINDGSLSQRGLASFSVLAGATARDDGVSVLSSNTGHMSAFVDGAGSTWDTGDYGFANDIVANGSDAPSLHITNGGRVISTSAHLGDVVSFIDFRVDGPGSIWSIAGPVTSSPEGGTIRILNGGAIESGAATFCCNSFLNVMAEISGSGSRWGVGGDLQVSSGRQSLFDVEAGGSLFVAGDSIFSGAASDAACFGCRQGASVLGAGSLFHTDGSLTLDGFGTRLVAGDGGRVEVGGGFTLGADAEFTIVLGAGDLDLDERILEVLGVATLAGTLDVDLAAGFAPTIGDVFEVLRGDSLIGQFDSHTGLDLGNGIVLVPEYGPDSLVLRAIPEPGTAALLGLGLAAVAARRRTTR